MVSCQVGGTQQDVVHNVSMEQHLNTKVVDNPFGQTLTDEDDAESASRRREDSEQLRSDNVGGAQEEVDHDIDMDHPESEKNGPWYKHRSNQWTSPFLYSNQWNSPFLSSNH